MNAKMQGTSGEHIACSDAFINGVRCYMTTEDSPYDLVLDYGKLRKVQVKSSNYTLNLDSVKFNVSKRNSLNRPYDDEIDLFALVWLDKKAVAWFPLAEANLWKMTINKKLFHEYPLERALSMIESN
tara:strand:- start:911 stop:1291 length:381 start_codon:yes stop_codon:yes gene_type:complete